MCLFFSCLSFFFFFFFFFDLLLQLLVQVFSTEKIRHCKHRTRVAFYHVNKQIGRPRARSPRIAQLARIASLSRICIMLSFALVLYARRARLPLGLVQRARQDRSWLLLHAVCSICIGREITGRNTSPSTHPALLSFYLEQSCIASEGKLDLDLQVAFLERRKESHSKGECYAKHRDVGLQ